MIGIQNKIMYYFIPIRLPKMNVGEGKEQRELSYNVSGSRNWYSHVGEQFGNIQLEKNSTDKKINYRVYLYNS